MLNLNLLAQALEDRFHNCPHCGTELKPWEPAIYVNGIADGRQATNHKWCTNCKCVTYEDLMALWVSVTTSA